MQGDLIALELKDETTFAALAMEIDSEEEVSFQSLKIKLSDVAQQVAKVAEELVEHARKAAPTDIEVTMRVGFSITNGKAVALLVDGKAEGAVELKLAWKDLAG
ncbi:CU044_2847 family protein [Micromonospora sp. CA-269861]|uniref:CU044_2847 family protein n=1 Tax=Micromonospora sp. CA-269861 TaxID=3239968 RepID=UPI003D9327FD